MGLTASIFKDAVIGTCANGGLSDGFKEVTIVNADGPFETHPQRPAVELRRGVYPGTVVAVPVDPPDGEVVGPMFGGSYIATSDSRFSEAIRKITGYRFYGAVPLHDRYETPAEYEALSR